MSNRYDNKEKLIYDGIGIAVLIGIIALIASMFNPPHNRIATRATIATEISNMRQILLALRTYAADEGGKFPPDLQTLLDQGYIDQAELLDSVYTKSGKAEPLIYRAGYVDADAPKIPLVISVELEKGKRVIGSVGGSVRETKMTKKKVEELLAEDPSAVP